MFLRISAIILIFLLTPNALFAGEQVDLFSSSPDNDSESYIQEASMRIYDPAGQFDPSLGAASALNRALGLLFSGYASEEQIRLEQELLKNTDASFTRSASFALKVLNELNLTQKVRFPEPVELKPFDLIPSRPSMPSPDNPNIIMVYYNDEEYLERLLQRLYFKLIQGPVLMTVPYRGEDESIPEKYRHWKNFMYGSDDDPMTWNDVRFVYVDWNLTQTVVLKYEDGRIACYDHGRKYYIDHTAAVALAGAMSAHPDLHELGGLEALNYLLVTKPKE